ncbi:MAG: DUF1446 domain-containing protein [Hellea sp.]|nr:DUF1446 domain-containing protein [Hellea sp.]
MESSIHIGGASGYWGESAMATPQLLSYKKLDYLVYDYLAEITMSIMAQAKAKDTNRGYATDFIDHVLKPNLEEIAKNKVKVISNAGGINPEECGRIVRRILKEKKLDLKVAIISGDNLIANLSEISKKKNKDMFSKTDFPKKVDIMSINAYLGAFPIAKALDEGADIIITGRCVDSAVTLGACIHAFSWGNDDLNALAGGSLAGHILECGPQATGGNFTDWEKVDDISNIGYPIAEIYPDGSFTVTKPNNTGGLVNIGTVSEQMLYEIGDPKAYILPDVICDFSGVKITQTDKNKVHVSASKGYEAPNSYKTCLTYKDGYRSGTYLTFYGENSTKKAQKFADAAITRTRKRISSSNLGEFEAISTEILGSESQFGNKLENTEVVLKIASKHNNKQAIELFLKEISGLSLATPPGLSSFTGAGRAKPSPIIRLFSYLTPKSDIKVKIDLDTKQEIFKDKISLKINKPLPAVFPEKVEQPELEVILKKLAWGRSGDKGNKANIGLIARKPEFIPYIWHSLTEKKLRETFQHFLGSKSMIERFYLPGSNSINILISDVLDGGGMASIRNDPQAKGFAQILLMQKISISKLISDNL